MVSTSAFSTALVALLAAQETTGFSFQASPAFKSTTTRRASSTSLSMSSRAYEEQLAAQVAMLSGNAANGAGPSSSSTTSSSLMSTAAAVAEPPVARQQMPAPVAPAPVPVAAPPAPVPVAVKPPPAPVPVPPPVQATPPPPAPAASSSSDSDGVTLGNAGLVFLGLPLYALGFQSLTATPPEAPVAPVAPAAPIVQNAGPIENKFTLPIQATTNNGAPAGVVVLSQPITKTEVRNLFNLWNDALATGDPEIVAQRYAKSGVLLPTLSDIPRNDFEGIKDYFVGFLKKRPTGKILEGEIFIGNNWAQDAGIYEFTFNDGSKVKARYSFVYAFEGGEWMISHHHSSLMPQETVRPVKVTEQEVRGFFDLWNNALATGDPQKVADRYSKDAVLLPTLSDEARYTNDRIADYFVGFLKKKPTGEILEGNIKMGPNWAQDAGIYEFTFEDGSKTKGRYSYVYTYENGEWKISNHHSSIMPQPAVAAMKKAAEYEKNQSAAASVMSDFDKKMAEMDARVAEMNKRLSIAVSEKSVSAAANVAEAVPELNLSTANTLTAIEASADASVMENAVENGAEI